MLCRQVNGMSRTSHLKKRSNVKTKCACKSQTHSNIMHQHHNSQFRKQYYHTQLYKLIQCLTQALDQLPTLSVLEQLDKESAPEELTKAINSLASEKASGEDGIPPEVSKYGKASLLPHHHQLPVCCWKEGQVP